MVALRQGLMGRLTTGWLLAACACSSGEPLGGGQGPGPGPAEAASAPGEFISAGKERVANPVVPASDLELVAAGNTDFGAALYRELREPGKNLFFSPYSVSQALAMVYAGARGETERQMGQGLRFSLPQDRFHPAMNALSQALLVPAGDTGQATPPQFHGVNATWGQKGFAFQPGFLDVLALHYGSGMHVVDFSANPSGIREDINAWVWEQTEQRIKDLLPPTAVTPLTRLILVNALHFKGAWQSPFREKGTQDAPFHTLDGATRQVPMMWGGRARHMKGEGFQALALDYVGRGFRMLIVLPDSGRFEEIESRLSANFLDGIRGALTGHQEDVHLPRFEVETSAPLIPKLLQLGIRDLFDEHADLSGLSSAESLVISSIEHKAFVSVNEKGTEAAAATAVVAGPPSMPAPFLVDRPFLFLIEHVSTRNVLFLGRYMTP
ncbi:serpin (serine proteinase inhibitor) family protein [Cystobacter fuscus DSM 2262]|uniref:Serpin (Serine proteinase inhibitor) family protein n=1 Tax=Cystobacter fuscus (strain ATCC 25194 / DSM 2262 / NBRC 100088 / M29) TaxID=1242864 RepID=S9R8E0_CYSF2|nr:serpin family protein [Cystobacter fuscus]EPX65373.1 serpin (serine proteinase inhibitor) family protein [Cystobacter fuscus DSM 2262]